MLQLTKHPAPTTAIAGRRSRLLGQVALVLLACGPVLLCESALAGASRLLAGAGALLALGGLVALVALMRTLEGALARLRREAAVDPLTGVLNRAAFTRNATGRLGSGASGFSPVVVMVDLDDFGALNKRRGHHEGDRLLGMAARRLERAAGLEGVVGRLGGDEFAALILASDAHTAGQRMLAALLAQPEPISASIGVASSGPRKRELTSLLREADVALRSAKQSGKSRVVAFSEGIDVPAELSRRQVHDAISKRRFEVVVQPIVDLRTGRIRAYEALARFTGAGPESPAHWLALAQSMGMRVDLELACLEGALGLLGDLPDGAQLSVNLSALALHASRTLEILNRHPAERIIVELTEESLGRDLRALRTGLAPLLARGMKLAVDDMGAGYSNLRQVVELSPSLLKLDRTLVHGIDRDPAQRLLIDALTGYAQRTGAEIVAEGIETHAELEIVRALGIAYGQGYLLGAPAPPWPKVAIAPREPSAHAGGALGSHPVTISSDTTTDEARARFVALPELESLVIVDEQRHPIALVTRHRLLSALGHRFGYALWGDRSVALVADRNFLCLPRGTSMSELARKSLARPLEQRHDPILLVDETGRLSAQVTISDLLLGGAISPAPIAGAAAASAAAPSHQVSVG